MSPLHPSESAGGAVSIRLPAGLRRHAAGRSSIEGIAATTVGEALRAVVATYPALGAQLFARDGRVFGFVGVFLGGADVRRLEGLGTPVGEGDVVSIIVAIAGG